MLNKNANCCNIEEHFKYGAVISAFNEHFTIFRILSIDIWQLKSKFFFLEFICLFTIYRTSKFFFLILLRETTFRSKAVPINRKSRHCCKTCSNGDFISISSQTFSATKVRNQNKDNIIEKKQLFGWPAVKKNIMCLNTKNIAIK